MQNEKYFFGDYKKIIIMQVCKQKAAILEFERNCWKDTMFLTILLY